MSSISDKNLERASRQPVANLYEGSGGQGALSHQFKCFGGAPNLVGRAFPLVCPPGSNIWIHKAIYLAKPGDVLVASTLGDRDHAYLGDLLVEAALQQNLGGVVIEGCVRDFKNLKGMPLPVFALGVSVNGPKKITEGGSLGDPIKIGPVTISKGDLVRGDEDGVVIVSADLLEKTLDEAEARDIQEENVRTKLREGKAPLYRILDFDLP